MKAIAFLFAASAIFCVAPVGMADSASVVKTFTQGLDEAEAQCTSAYRLALLNQRLHAMAAEQAFRNYGTRPDERAAEAEMEKDSNADVACRAKAKQTGEDLYRAFAGSTRDSALKADAKKVFAAWLAYLNRAISDPPDPNSLALMNYTQAKSELEADAIEP